MTQEEIKKKALEAYPQEEYFDTASKNYYDDNEETREGYIKALTEIESLPKIKGWVARDSNNELHVFTEKPVRDHLSLIWVTSRAIRNPIAKEYYQELSFEDEPIEVELIIRNRYESK